jgi:hypothetical protein
LGQPPAVEEREECGAQHRRRGGSPEKLVRGGRALRWVTIERAGGAGSHAQEGNEARRGDARGVMVMVRVESGATEEAGEGGLANNPKFFFFRNFIGFCPFGRISDHLDGTLTLVPRGYVDELRWSPAPIFGRMTTPRLWPRGRRLGVGPAETGVSIHTKPWSSG